MSSWPAAAAAGAGVDTWGRDDKMAESWWVDVSTRGGRVWVGWGLCLMTPEEPWQKSGRCGGTLFKVEKIDIDKLIRICLGAGV